MVDYSACVWCLASAFFLVANRRLTPLFEEVWLYKIFDTPQLWPLSTLLMSYFIQNGVLFVNYSAQWKDNTAECPLRLTYLVIDKLTCNTKTSTILVNTHNSKCCHICDIDNYSKYWFWWHAYLNHALNQTISKTWHFCLTKVNNLFTVDVSISFIQSMSLAFFLFCSFLIQLFEKLVNMTYIKEMRNKNDSQKRSCWDYADNSLLTLSIS